MIWLILQRNNGRTNGWTATGPFTTVSVAEQALLAALASPTCESGRVMALPELRRSDPGSFDRMDGTGFGDAVRMALAFSRMSVQTDYPETSEMPTEILADFLGDRADPREVLFR